MGGVAAEVPCKELDTQSASLCEMTVVDLQLVFDCLFDAVG